MSYLIKRKELGLWSNTSDSEELDGEEVFRVHENGDITKVERRGKKINSFAQERKIFQKIEIKNSKK